MIVTAQGNHKGLPLSTEASVLRLFGVQRFSFGIRDFATPKAEK
jgi:hypothetical protein